MEISELQSGEERRSKKTSGCPRQLIDLTAPIDLNQGQDLTLPPDWRNLTAYSDWLLLTDRCVLTGCLLINSCDTYHSMIVRFALPATRGFLVSSRQRKTSGTRVRRETMTLKTLEQSFGQ